MASSCSQFAVESGHVHARHRASVPHTVTRPQIVHSPSRPRKRHHQRGTIVYWNAPTAPSSTLRHCGWIVVMASWSGFGGRRPPTVPQYRSTFERPAVVGVGQCDGEAAVGTDNALAALTGLAGSDCVVVQDGQRLAGIGGGA